MPLTEQAPIAAFKVSSFSDETFFSAFESDLLTINQAKKHRRVAYLYGYLKDIGALTVVEEADYTDRDYLEDFAHYYVRSFRPYKRRCRRLHFFSRVFSSEQFLSWIVATESVEDLQKCYLGFVVIRPLPEAIIGRTVLATYGDDGGRRHYPVTLQYASNLFGTPLETKSLAFQEQDTVLAACATVALWSAFQQCARRFGTIAPSPAEITGAATTTDIRARTLPSKGLTLSQMSRAVQAVGLEPEVYSCTSSLPLSSLIYAYVAAGLPVVLVVDIEGQGHAITVAGYSMRDTRQLTREDMAPASPPIRRIGLRIDELYGHDDQVGPFARMKLKAGASPDAQDSVLEFTGSWFADDKVTQLTLRPRHVIVPVYHKIRVTFLDIQQWLAAFSRLAAQVIADFEPFEWDLRLITGNEFKGAIRVVALEAERERLLTQALPRFLWRGTLQTPGKPAVDLIFDATDMARSYPFHDALFYDTELARGIGTIVRAGDLQDVLADLITPQFRDFLQTKTSSFV